MTDTGFKITSLNRLKQALYYEIFRAYETGESRLQRQLIRFLLWLPATLLSRKALAFETLVATGDFCEACRRYQNDFVAAVDSSGQELIPAHGPLVIASNHPGTIDFMVLAAQLQRKDVKLIARDMDFLRQLPATASHLIFSTRDTLDRFGVLRAVLRHLKAGGCLLLFPSGNLDPDPAVLAGARESLNTWSRSLDLILRKVPQTVVVPAIVSGLITERVLRFPLIRSQQNRFRQQVSAEILQISTQLIFPGRLAPTPRITFAEPISTELQSNPEDHWDALQEIIARAGRLLRDEHPRYEFRAAALI